MSSVSKRCLLGGGGEKLGEGRVGVTTGLTRLALSESGVAPPRLERASSA